MSNPENDTPETEQVEAEGIALPLSALMQAAGSRLRSAEGVGSMLHEVANFVDQKSFAQPGLIPDPETGSMVSVILKPDGSVEKLGADWFDEHNGQPRFRRGTARMTTLDSFIAHVNRFGDEDSAVFVNDSDKPSLLAVLDYHCRDRLRLEGEADQVGERIHGDYRFGKHRTVFDFPLSEEWQAWNEVSGDPMTMIEFSQFLEDRANDIDAFDDGAIPDSLTRFVEKNGGKSNIAMFGQLLELSRGLKVNENANVEQAINLANGTGEIRFAAEHQTSVKVPTMFFIAIPIFKRGAFYRLGVDLRYRKVPGGLTFTVRLHRPDLSFDHAIREAVDRVAAETEAQLLFGSPE